MTNIQDFALPDRQQFISTGGRTLLQKRLDAITWMGTKYVLHPINRVQKLPEPLPDVFRWQPKVLRKGRK